MSMSCLVPVLIQLGTCIWYVLSPSSTPHSAKQWFQLSSVHSKPGRPHLLCVRLSLCSANAATEQELLKVCYSERKYFHLSEAEGGVVSHLVSHLSTLI